ncbi:MAG TPA: hypothetical protein PKY82_01110 [Pyrinomonadaceae bacterium]|nr:hypothetical protein [Pyrinomonadaceae bacterium]
MSFRKKRNTHDEWITYRDKMSDLFMLFIDRNLASVNQNSFEDYLTEGNNEKFHTPITNLSDEKFLVLEKIVEGWESFAVGFDLFYSERIKRFNRCG